MIRPSRRRYGLILASLVLGLSACTPSSATGSDGASVPGMVDSSRLPHWHEGPAVGEIRLMATNYETNGWAYTDGKQLAIAQRAPLFDVLGARFGGDGTTNFALPRLAPVRTANGVDLRPQIVLDGSAAHYEGAGEGLGDGVVGEVRRWPGERVPSGWLPCDGRELPIAGHERLFAVIGTTFGGDGQTTFKLPNLDADEGAPYLINLAGWFPKGASPLTFASEIVLFAGSTLPDNWALCDGQPVRIQQNQALYALLGTRFGGDGRWSYFLPELTFDANPAIRYAISVHGIFPTRN